MKRLRLREADELVSDGAWLSDPDRVIGGVGADRDPKVFVFNPLLSADLGCVSGLTESPLAPDGPLPLASNGNVRRCLDSHHHPRVPP